MSQGTISDVAAEIIYRHYKFCISRAKIVYFRTGYSLMFVCVEVLRPSQPNGVMSSAVSLPNHTFTGQA